MLNSLGHRKPGLGKDTYSQGFNGSHKTKGVTGVELKEMIDKRNHLISILTNDDSEFLDMLDEIFRLTDIIKKENADGNQ